MPRKQKSEMDLGTEHFARWTSHGAGKFITKVRDMDAWIAGNRSNANKRRVSLAGHPTLADGRRVSGLIIRHRSAGQNRHNAGHAPPAGEWCEGSITFWEPEPSGYAVWQLVSLEPLHVEPSILCNCGDHGFIRDSVWCPA